MFVQFTKFPQVRAAQLMFLLDASVQRRFPKGLKVHVHVLCGTGCLAELAAAFKVGGSPPFSVV